MTIGNNKMGSQNRFTVISTEDRVFRFRFEGFLDDEFLDEWEEKIVEQYTKATLSFKGEPFINLADLRDLKPLTERARLLVERLMIISRKNNVYASINIKNPKSVFAEMGVRSAGEHTETNSYRIIVSSLEEAEDILKEKLEALRAR
jgi:hypothetical protein